MTEGTTDNSADNADIPDNPENQNPIKGDSSLDLMPTAELFDAITRRCEGAVLIIGQKKSKNPDDYAGEYWFHGGAFIALGLLQWFKNLLETDMCRTAFNDREGDDEF